MVKNFKKISNKIKWQFLDLVEKGFKYHLGGTASCLDLMTVLFYGGYINLSKNNRSVFLLSKGHALGALYSILINQKLVTKQKLINLKKRGEIGGQLDIFKLPKFIDTNTGSLGHAIGVGIGHALANIRKKVWVIIGDAEIDEGSVWEALFYISEKKINNIIIIIDRNKISASVKIDKKEIFDSKFLENLNLKIFYINGHKHKEIKNCYDRAIKLKKSSIIIADTIKGKGLGVAENNLEYSHQSLPINEIKRVKKIYE